MEDQMKKAIAVYYSIDEDSTFEQAAQEILKLLVETANSSPNQDRKIYIDIEGHVDSSGRYDDDMRELQQNFITDFLLQYFTEVNTPLKKYVNPKPQNNDIPNELRILRS